MGSALSSVIKEATSSADDKIDELDTALQNQKAMLDQLEKGYTAKYKVLLAELKEQGIVVTWPEARVQKKATVTQDADKMKGMVDGLGDTVGSMGKAVFGGGERSEAMEATVNNFEALVKDGLECFLGAKSGEINEILSQFYYVKEDNIKLVYVNSFTINMKATGGGLTKNVGSYIYQCEAGDVSVYDSNLGTLATKISSATGKSQIDTLKLLNAIRELEEQIRNKPSAPVTLMSMPSATNENKKLKLDHEASLKLKKKELLKILF